MGNHCSLRMTWAQPAYARIFTDMLQWRIHDTILSKAVAVIMLIAVRQSGHTMISNAATFGGAPPGVLT